MERSSSFNGPLSASFVLDPSLNPGNTLDIPLDAKNNDYSDLVEFSLNVLDSIIDQPVPQTACAG